MFRIKCTCGRMLESAQSLAGKMIRCRNCERAIKIEEKPDGSLLAVAQGPEIFLPDYVRKARNEMLLGNVKVDDKICLHCGAVNSTRAARCGECGREWGEPDPDTAPDLQVTEDFKSEVAEETEEERERIFGDIDSFELLDAGGSTTPEEDKPDNTPHIPRRTPIAQRHRKGRRPPPRRGRRPRR
jgi:ribosomal protein L40E